MRVKRAIKLSLLGLCALVLFAMVPLLYQFNSYYDPLQDEVVTRLSTVRWTIPSRIYSESEIIYPGLKISDLGMMPRLARLNYHPVPPDTEVKARGEYTYNQKKGQLEIFLHSFAYPYKTFPGQLVTMTLAPDGTIQSIHDAATHEEIFLLELEPEMLGAIFQGDWEQRRLLPLTEMPPAFIDAILAAEDHRFYEHHGIDLIRSSKAAWINFTHGHVVQGGSTLTQQLMKNFFLTSKRDWHRKVKEALMAYIAERRYSKDEIL